MNKIMLIASREYWVRVKKKQFLIMTLVGPLLFSLLMVIPMLLVLYGSDSHTVLVADQSGQFNDAFQDSKKLKFEIRKESPEELKAGLDSLEDTGILVIPAKFSTQNPEGIQYFGKNPLSADQEMRISNAISEKIDGERLAMKGLNKSFIDSLNTDVQIQTFKMGDQGFEDSSSGASNAVAFGSSILMYMFILLYGMQVLKGVVEEKTNRIIEVIISSVKPFQLMLGKILGIGAVSLTQFLLWILLSMGIFTAASTFLKVPEASKEEISMVKGMNPETQKVLEQKMVDQSKPAMMKALETLDLGKNIVVFLIYFVLAYLFYASIFAAIGSAVDNETDSQQLLFPVTVPLLIGYLLGIMVSSDPGNQVGFWASMIPFTSPIVMMARMPYGVPTWELLLSITLLIGAFFAMTWVASRIYRVGILMYGKKATFKEILKWVTYQG